MSISVFINNTKMHIIQGKKGEKKLVEKQFSLLLEAYVIKRIYKFYNNLLNFKFFLL